MKITRSSQLEYIPASHEDPKNPGSLKKVIAHASDLLGGQIQMINWAKLPKGKSFKAHFHQDMQEIFIILDGSATITISDESETIYKGDLVIIPIKATHTMTAKDQDCTYLAMGISKEGKGKTINV